MATTASKQEEPTVYEAGDAFNPSERGARAKDEQPHYLITRDFNSTALTDGKCRMEEMRIVRDVPTTETGWHIHLLDLQLFYVIKGEVGIELEDRVIKMKPGMCIRLPGGIPHRQFSITRDAEMIEVTMPAKFETKRIPPPAKRSTGQ